IATERILRANGAVVGSLRCRISFCREPKWFVSFRVPKEIFLFETKPEVIVVIIDGSATVAFVRRAIGIENFAHHEEGILAPWIGEECHRLQEAVRVAASSLLCRASIKAPDGTILQSS